MRIAIEHARNIDRVVEFFEGTAYTPRRVDDGTVILEPPDRISAGLARREVEIYLRVFERVHPGVGASIVG